MKSTGIIRKLDDLGRLVIPVEIRRAQGIGDHEPIEMFVEGDKIVLQKYVKDDLKGWIPVGEREPTEFDFKEDDTVLAVWPSGVRRAVPWRWVLNPEIKITHWMPMPEPPICDL